MSGKLQRKWIRFKKMGLEMSFWDKPLGVYNGRKINIQDQKSEKYSWAGDEKFKNWFLMVV